MSTNHTIGSIRTTLSNYKIPAKHIKDKNGLPYIAWSYALGMFLKHYPEARWEFTQWEQADGTMLDVQYYKDGSCMVECNVWIGDIKMHMWLPVTDFRNKPVGNCQDINTAKMRCLTKCIAVCFGLGADVYGMDMLQEINEGGVEDSSNESPIPKSTSAIKPPSSFTSEPDSPQRLKGVDKVMVGEDKGRTYNDAYDNCTNIEKVRKDLKKWRGKTSPSVDQQTHLNTLIAMESHINAQIEKSLTK